MRCGGFYRVLPTLLFVFLLTPQLLGQACPDPVEQSELSPGINLRAPGCGYCEAPLDDDDSAGDDDDDSAGDDDDSSGDDDDATGDDDDATGDDDDSGDDDDDSASSMSTLLLHLAP